MSQWIRSGQTVSSIPFGYDRYGRPLRVWRRRRKDVTLRDCFAYPVVDGPGIALLVLMPPFLAIMALPIFDMMVHFRPGNALNPVALLILPFTLPLVISVVLTVGYILIFLGRVLTTSATGEDDHPRWPVWDRTEILDELGRWIWAGLLGLVVGGFPAVTYWINCGEVDWLDGFLFLDLAILGAGYAQMALMAALLHETLIAANPITVLRSIGRLGWDYLGPCLVTGLAIAVDVTAWSFVLLHSPSVMLGVLGLWACWVFTLYMAAVICRVLGTTYYKHAATLGWFRTAPRG
jgi:hypothetical protein